MRNRIFIRVVTIVALLGIGTVFFNLIGYHHIHLCLSGGVISHAHPYSQDGQNDFPAGAHRHTPFEMIYYELASNVLDLVLLIFVSLGVILRRFIFIPFCPNQYIPQKFETTRPIRAPPGIDSYYSID